jgi:HEPN domain-containing protein
MRRDPRGEALRWLAQAEEEFKDASTLAKAGRYYLVLYLCQQSAEKALKAFMYLREEEPVLTHSVATLSTLAASVDRDFASLKDAKRLDEYYIPTRYPNGLPDGIPARHYDDPGEAERALALSERVLALVRMKIARQ